MNLDYVEILIVGLQGRKTSPRKSLHLLKAINVFEVLKILMKVQP